MIPVLQQPEPAGFDARVRQPGLQYLNTAASSAKPSSRLPTFWQSINNELHGAYGGICAYTCMYLVGTGSVDHFLPKKTNPRLAYEWSNYRLSSGRANSRKGNHTGILDPFHIRSQWFELTFPACLVVPGGNLPQSRLPEATRTIDLLKLNRRRSSTGTMRYHHVLERWARATRILGGPISVHRERTEEAGPAGRLELALQGSVMVNVIFLFFPLRGIFI